MRGIDERIWIGRELELDEELGISTRSRDGEGRRICLGEKVLGSILDACVEIVLLRVCILEQKPWVGVLGIVLVVFVRKREVVGVVGGEGMLGLRVCLRGMTALVWVEESGV